MILIYLGGGPSHHDMWDPKPDTPAELRGEFKSIATNLPGVKICEQLPLMAHPADKLTIIILFLPGGPPHQDMWDMKPDAPAERRGEFTPIQTNVPGIEICEQFPRMANTADKITIIRFAGFRAFQAVNRLWAHFFGHGLVDPVDAAHAHRNVRPKARRYRRDLAATIFHPLGTVQNPCEFKPVATNVPGVPWCADPLRQVPPSSVRPEHPERLLRGPRPLPSSACCRPRPSCRHSWPTLHFHGDLSHQQRKMIPTTDCTFRTVPNRKRLGRTDNLL